MKKIFAVSLISLLIGCSVPAASNESQEVLNIYSARHYDLDKDMIEAFKLETGMIVNVIEGRNDELLERMIREKNNPQADLYITVGAESLATALKEDLFQDVDLSSFQAVLDPTVYGNKWVGITKRARVIVYNNQLERPNIQTYQDLTNPQWENKILVRSATSSYNIALLASMIQQSSVSNAQAWASDVVKNFARKPTGNDRDQARAVIAGLGDLAIMNTYYLILMENASDPADREIAQQLGVIFVEDTHMNISYASIINGAKNSKNAQRFIEYLLSKDNQTRFMNENGEFPVRIDMKLNPTIESWGPYTTAPINYETLGDYYAQAVISFDLAKWE